MTGRNWWPCRAAERLALGTLLAACAGLSAAPAVARAAEAPPAAPTPDTAPAPPEAASAAGSAASGASTAAAPAAAPASAPEPLPYAEGTLWRLTAPNGAVSHLLGTIHIGRALELGVPAQAWAVLHASRRLVVELAGDQVRPAQLDQLQRLAPHQTLAGALSPQELALLQRRLSQAGLTLHAPLRYRPWVLAQLLQSAAPLTLQTLDDRLVWLARRQRLEVLSLETLAEQFAAFECIAPAEQVLLLKDTLALEEDFFDALNRDSLALYRAQRTGDLMAMIDRRFPVSEAARAAAARAGRCIVDERNARFAQRLQPLLAGDAAFAAIGSAHLVGREGVLARLVRAGFRAERVTDGPDAQALAVVPAASAASQAMPQAKVQP